MSTDQKYQSIQIGIPGNINHQNNNQSAKLTASKDS